jgi:hypothetical protein
MLNTKITNTNTENINTNNENNFNNINNNNMNINQINFSNIIMEENKSFNKKLLLNNKLLSSVNIKKPFLYKKTLKKNKSFNVLDNIFSNKFYNSEIPLKKGMELNKYLMQNIKDDPKRSKLNKSLIGNNMNIYHYLVKVCRFWGSFSNYVYPIIIHDKYKTKKNEKKENDENKILKLPQLYTNSSRVFNVKKKLNKNNYNYNYDYNYDYFNNYNYKNICL